MDVTTTLPSLEDAALTVLHGNASRLQRSGTAAQKAAATALIPAIVAEQETRRDAKLALAKEAAALAPKRVVKRKAS